MRKIIFFLLIFLIGAGIGLLTMVSLSQGQTAQNTRRWDLHSGAWDTFTALRDSATSDTIWFKYNIGSDSVFYTEVFKVWPFMDVWATVVDSFTTDRDSAKFVVRFLQSGESFDTTGATQFVRVKTLSWKSTSSHTATDTITALGRYAANITDDPIYSFRWGRLELECFEDTGHIDGNYIFLVITGWNNFK